MTAHSQAVLQRIKKFIEDVYYDVIFQRNLPDILLISPTVIMSIHTFTQIQANEILFTVAFIVEEFMTVHY